MVGTSFFSPMAAGCAVLLRKRFPNATPDEVEEALESSSVQVSDPKQRAELSGSEVQ